MRPELKMQVLDCRRPIEELRMERKPRRRKSPEREKNWNPNRKEEGKTFGFINLASIH